MTNYITINIDYKSTFASMISYYTASIIDSDNVKCNGIKYENGLWTPEYMLPLGETIVNYKNNIIKILYQEEGKPVGLYFSVDKFKTLKIMIQYNDYNDKNIKKNILESFMIDSRKYFDRKNDDKVTCKILKDMGWTTLSELPKRKMDTIYLPQNTKDKIYNDMKQFIESENEYISLGIPWKRNYLLEGPPGTGKSSLIFALASIFNYNINIINLGPKVDDSVFMSAVSALSEKTILLLEDIDGLFVDRKHNDCNKSMVSFSGILNVLDGMARKNGLITFLTTNYKDRLDSALLRPGRVDLILTFKHAEKEQVVQMANKILPDFDKVDKLWNLMSHKKIKTCMYQQFFLECRFQKLDPFKNIKRFKEILDEKKSIAPDGLYL